VRCPRRAPGAILGAAILAALAAGTAGCAAKRRAPALPPEQAYQAAMRKIEKKRYYTARAQLQELLPRIPPDDRELLPKVQLAIADAYYRDGGLLNYGEALNGYRNFLTYYPQHERADHAQFMVGMSLFQQALSPDRDQSVTLRAIDEFRKVQQVFPDSPYAAQARERTQDCLDRLADHERLIGWFYQRRDAWQAAVDRYRYILEHYPRYRRMSRVLFDLGRTLLDAGNRDDAEEAFQRLYHDHPDDPLTAKARELLTKHDKEARRKVLKDGD
jgi:outer membrane protein assembly factor BamD